MQRIWHCSGQMDLPFDESSNATSSTALVEEPPLEDVTLSHMKNFGIETPYLLENLPQYNHYLKKSWMRDLDYDNLLLRTMFAGIKNSKDTPPEIFDGLNALEICLMEAGIFKRKYIQLGKIPIQIGGEFNPRTILVQRDIQSIGPESRIETEGHLANTNLYGIINYLLEATDVRNIHSKYRKDWQTIFQSESQRKRQKRFRRLNPYEPSTLKRRLDQIETEYPFALETFKRVLTEQIIYGRFVKMDEYGNPKEIIHPEGFETPGRTYHRHIPGKSFWRLNEYAEQIHDYFKQKEKIMRNKT